MNEKEATRTELVDAALDHYERISHECSEWNSLIPKVLEHYKLCMEIEARDGVRVSYKGHDPNLDLEITKALEAIGLKWWAQGFNHETERRDICFDRVSI